MLSGNHCRRIEDGYFDLGFPIAGGLTAHGMALESRLHASRILAESEAMP
ncbi:hypothetical protein SAMN04488120_11243 [Fontimonas thermophila]|uniref:Uncharacterized protein n=1 Tax=Fontimonas thermophila TaxID=1076937 RepID=A0A1I2K8F3_9GAMM|nr:hypothetical protein [Fontimonas thermophila]SFF61156.1 hypothetical protein SAMN04488120_11243 [Fontimonas thermophila]